MTNNQISFLNYQEANRANLAREAENQRANLARERETNRSNVANETEARRSNLARETEINRANLAKEYETNRTNVAHEQIDIGKLHETVRSNTEARRHNKALESISSTQNALAKERNEIEKYIAELRNSMEASRLSFDQQREAQRIVESLRDYQLALGKMLTSGFDPRYITGFNATRGVASTAIAAGLGASAGSSFGARNGNRITGSRPSSLFATVLNRLSKAPLLLFFRNLFPDTISSSRVHSQESIM